MAIMRCELLVDVPFDALDDLRQAVNGSSPALVPFRAVVTAQFSATSAIELATAVIAWTGPPAVAAQALAALLHGFTAHRRVHMVIDGYEFNGTDKHLAAKFIEAALEVKDGA